MATTACLALLYPRFCTRIVDPRVCPREMKGIIAFVRCILGTSLVGKFQAWYLVNESRCAMQAGDLSINRSGAPVRK